MSKKSNRFSSELRERAVRMVLKHRDEYHSLWASIESISPKIGHMLQIPNNWNRQHEVNAGMRDVVSSDARARIKEQERKVPSRTTCWTDNCGVSNTSRWHAAWPSALFGRLWSLWGKLCLPQRTAPGGGGNIPSAALMTLLTNPLTLGFWLWLAYPVGNLVLGVPTVQDSAFVADWAQPWQDIGGAVSLGMGIFSVVGAALSYTLVKLGWRLRVAFRRRQSNASV